MLTLIPLLSLAWMLVTEPIVPAPGESPDTDVVSYRCPPCGCASDDETFDEPGDCPSCGMPLREIDPDGATPITARIVELDARVDTVVGKTTTIPSRFEGLPVVEPHITCHPKNSDHLLVAAMVVTDIEDPYASSRLSSFVSKDGGATWRETAHDWWGYDPWTAMLEDGTTVMSWIGTPGSFGHRYPIRFFSSKDGGVTWSDSVQTLDGNHDGTKLIAQGSRFWFTTVKFQQTGGADVVLYGRDRSGSFERAATIDGGGERLNFCEPAALASGRVIVPASRFLHDVWVQSFDPKTSTLGERSHISRAPGGNRGYMRLAADSSARSEYRDRLYFVRAVSTERTAQGVWLNTSSDGAATWSEDLRIDRFEGDAPSRALVPSVAVNRDGVVGISWMDVRDDESGRGYDLYFAISRDGGRSFQRPVRITTTSSNPRTEANADVANRFPGGGHYLGLDCRADGRFQLAWCDSSSGVFELRTCDVAVTTTR